MAMRIIVTAGPTREYIDTVRFITNASSGRMGIAVAAAAAAAGHEVTLLLGGDILLFGDKRQDEGSSESPAAAKNLPAPRDAEKKNVPFLPAQVALVRFTSVADLQAALAERFDACDVLVMAAAVGDFQVKNPMPAKIRRACGPITITLFPTEDILAGLGKRKRPGQRIVAFAVEDGTPEAIEKKARAEMSAKNADFVVVNTLAAMAAEESLAAMLTPQGLAIPWAMRAKEELAEEIVKALGSIR
jgi:phosphopantothenoylcysteine decarboxylase/phosphopantothenate--cysteine ligase